MTSDNSVKRQACPGSPNLAKRCCDGTGRSKPFTLEERTSETFAIFGKSEFETEPVQEIYYKDPMFYNHGDAHRLQGINIRKYWNSYTESFVIHWSKRNGIMNGKPLPNSHQQVPSFLLIL